MICFLFTLAINSAPCPLGYQGIPCQLCKKGFYRNDPLEKNCQRCPNLSKQEVSSNEFRINKCIPEKCDSKQVHLKLGINPNCLSTFWVFNYLLVTYFGTLSYCYCVLVSIYFFVLAIKLRKQNVAKLTQKLVTNLNGTAILDNRI